MYDFIKFDESAVLEEAIAKYEEATKTTLYAGDERRILINSFMYPAKLIAEKANYLANQYFAQTAEMPFLQYIGEGRNVYILQAEKSLVTMRFRIAALQTFDITIPAGIRVTPDGIHYYATQNAGIIIQNSLYTDIICEATVAGKGHNGFIAGTINTLVDNVLYISNVTNIDISSGGSETEDTESYRERILLKPFGYNTAGAEEAYIYHTKSADSSIGSVTVTTEPATVIITILNKDGTIPSDLVVDRVQNALNGKEVRPLTDNVIIQKPTIVSYEININYTVSEEDKSNENSIKANVEAAVKAYVLYQSSELGKAINPDVLRKYILNAGAYTCTINSPSYIAVNKQSIAQISGEPEVTYTGIV